MALTTLLKQYRIAYEQRPGSPELVLSCPLCVTQGRDRQHAQLHFNTVKRGGHCWRCGWAGKEKDLLALLHIRACMPLDMGEEDVPVSAVPQKRESLFPRDAVPATRNRDAMAYLHSRSLNENTVKQFGIFYCADGFYARRLVIPVLDRRGRYCSFVTRAIDADVEKKYLYPKGSAMHTLLYNLHWLQQTSQVWLVEGIFDAIHCFPHAVATFGKRVSPQQIAQLRMHGITRVCLLYDAEAWQKTPDLWEKAERALSQHFFTSSVKLPSDTPTEFDLCYLKNVCRGAL